MELIPEKFINEKEKNVMKFSNAAKGVSKIFTAEILGLISYVLLGIGSISVIGAAVSSGDKVSKAATGTIVGGGVLATIGAIIMIVGAIINIVGLVQAGKDEPFFKYALYAMIIFFIFSLIVNFVMSASGYNYNGYANSGETLINLIVNVLVIQGIINLANAKQNAKVASKGLLIFKLIIAVAILEIIASIIGAVTQSTAAAVVVLALALAALVLGIVRYIMYLSMLSNAKKMLADDAE